MEMRYDMHIHSKYSHDGTLEPGKILKIARKKGLDGIAITDHGTIKGALKARRERRYMRDAVDVIVGAEILTDIGEVIGLFIEEEITSTDFECVIEEIKSQGGIVVLPHPFDEIRRSSLHPRDEHARFIDCVEVMNARCRLQKFNEHAMKFAVEHDLGMTAGSDAHFADEIGNAGVCIDGDIKKSLLRGKVRIFGNKTPILRIMLSKLKSELRLVE